jgi:hypothetical protein
MLPVDSSMYAQFSGGMRTEVKSAFLKRNGNIPAAAMAWDSFASGQSDRLAVMGHDLFLGCSQVWGLESVSLGGCSIIHLA